MTDNKIDEQDILNFALNLEYLEAEFYTYAIWPVSGLSVAGGVAHKL